jgi:hypothetical protein
MRRALFGLLAGGHQSYPVPTLHLIPQLSLAPRIVLTSDLCIKVLKRAPENDPTCISDIPFLAFAPSLFSFGIPLTRPRVPI